MEPEWVDIAKRMLGISEDSPLPPLLAEQLWRADDLLHKIGSALTSPDAIACIVSDWVQRGPPQRIKRPGGK